MTKLNLSFFFHEESSIVVFQPAYWQEAAINKEVAALHYFTVLTAKEKVGHTSTYGNISLKALEARKTTQENILAILNL